MDPVVPRLEECTRRRRRRLLFRHSRVPVRVMIPNFFTLLGLCAGLTSIRMSIEGRWELALAAIVFAVLLDGLDGRIARMLKASSRFGAELDSLADFVNFGVAPSFFLFTWGLHSLKSVGWIAVMIFSLAAALRLARFNVLSEEESPQWKYNYFVGMPTPAAAIVLLLPFYVSQLGYDVRSFPWSLYLVLTYVLFVSITMVSVFPTFSGKLMGGRVGREWVLPLFILAVGIVAFLVTYPYAGLAALCVFYFISMPIAWLYYRNQHTINSLEETDSQDKKSDIPSGYEEDEWHTTERWIGLRRSSPRGKEAIDLQKAGRKLGDKLRLHKKI